MIPSRGMSLRVIANRDILLEAVINFLALLMESGNDQN